MGLIIFSLIQGMKMYRKYLKELYRNITEIISQMEVLKLKKKRIHKNNIEITLTDAATGFKNNFAVSTQLDYELEKIRHKGQVACEAIDMILTTINDKNNFSKSQKLTK